MADPGNDGMMIGALLAIPSLEVRRRVDAALAEAGFDDYARRTSPSSSGWGPTGTG